MITEDAIIFERVFNAPREAVWDAWINPEKIKKWWGPKDFTAPSIQNDFRVGGKYLYSMHGPAGSQWDQDTWSGGEYKEIVPMEKIVVSDYFTDEHGNKIEPVEAGMESADFPSESIITIKFEDAGEGKTKLSIIYPKPESEAAFEAMKKSGMDEGWATTLDKLQNVVEGGE